MVDLLQVYENFFKNSAHQFRRPFIIRWMLLVIAIGSGLNFPVSANDRKSQQFVDSLDIGIDQKRNTSRDSRQFKPISVLKWMKTLPRSVCYESEGLGCFDLNNEDVYKMAHSGVLPISPQQMGVFYELITPGSQAGRRFTYTTEPSTMGFVVTQPLVVVVHGMSSSIDKQFIREIPDAFVAKEPNYNILLVDWRNGAAFDLLPRTYHQAAANTEMAARIIGNFLIKVNEQVKLEYSSMHLIGMSLGAQAVGLTGSWVQGKLGNVKLGRITGLDPAFPLFGERAYSEAQQRKWSVDSSDASFVDIIHTNYQSKILFKGLGQQLPLGHVDFYINNGIYQPDCPPDMFSAIIKNYVLGVWYPSYSCSHDVAYYVFAESIRRRGDCAMVSSGGCQSHDDYMRGNCFFNTSGQSASGAVGLYAKEAPGRGVQWALIRGQPEGTKTGYCGFTWLVELELSSSQQNLVGLLYINSNYTLYSTSSSGQTFSSTITRGKYKGLVSTEGADVASVVLKHELKPTSYTKNQKGFLAAFSSLFSLRRLFEPLERFSLNLFGISRTMGSLSVSYVKLLDANANVRFQSCNTEPISFTGSTTVQLKTSCS